MGTQEQKPKSISIKGRRYNGMIVIFAALWRSISWIWKILILGTIVGVLGNAVFIFLTMGKVDFTGTFTVITWLSTYQVLCLTILIPILILTLCSYIAHRLQQQAEYKNQRVQDESLVVVAKGVQRALEELSAKPATPITHSFPIDQDKAIKKPAAKPPSNQPMVPMQVPRSKPANPVYPANAKETISPPPSLDTPLYIYQNHTDHVHAVAWSPDGAQIASGSDDHTVQVWDASNGHKTFSYKGHLEVYALVWSPNSARVYSGGGEGEIQEWDIFGKSKVFTYKGHFDAIYALAFSPDGTHIASASWDKTVRVWNAATRLCTLTYKGHSDWVKTLSWSPDSSCIVSGSSDNTVQVWKAATGRNIFTYHGSHDNAIESVAWSPDGTHIASGGLDKTIQVWDATTGNLFSTYRGHSHFVNAITWSPDGAHIASGSWDKTIQVWDATTGNLFSTYRGHSYSVNAVVWSPDGTRIASASDDRTVYIWQAIT